MKLAAIIFLIVLALFVFIVWLRRKLFGCPHCGYVGKQTIEYDHFDPHPKVYCKKCKLPYYTWD